MEYSLPIEHILKNGLQVLMELPRKPSSPQKHSAPAQENYSYQIIKLVNLAPHHPCHSSVNAILTIESTKSWKQWLQTYEFLWPITYHRKGCLTYFFFFPYILHYGIQISLQSIWGSNFNHTWKTSCIGTWHKSSSSPASTVQEETCWRLEVRADIAEAIFHTSHSLSLASV